MGCNNGFKNRQVFKFVKNVTFTPDGGDAIDFDGAVRVEVDGSATTSETQVANNIHPDTNITQLVKYTASVVFQDAQKFDITNIYPGVCGALAFDNEAHTASADDLSYALEPCKIISLPTTLEAGGGAQEVSMDLEAWSDDGTSHPLAIT